MDKKPCFAILTISNWISHQYKNLLMEMRFHDDHPIYSEKEKRWYIIPLHGKYNDNFELSLKSLKQKLLEMGFYVNYKIYFSSWNGIPDEYVAQRARKYYEN